VSDISVVIYEPDATDLVLLDNETTVLVFEHETTVVTSDTAGPQGAPGSSGSSDFSVIAGQAVSAGRLVTVTAAGAFYFDGTDLAEYGKLVGITKNAAALGDTVNVAVSGEVTLVGAGYTPGARFWAGVNGTLLTTPPVTGMIIPVGYAIDADNINIQITSYLEA